MYKSVDNIIIIVVIVVIGLVSKLAMDFLFSLPPFSNTPEQQMISAVTGTAVSLGLILAKFKDDNFKF